MEEAKGIRDEKCKRGEPSTVLSIGELSWSWRLSLIVAGPLFTFSSQLTVSPLFLLWAIFKSNLQFYLLPLFSTYVIMIPEHLNTKI